MSKVRPATTLVWDPFLRLFHWGLAAAVTMAAVTGFFGGASVLTWHLVGGLGAVALVLARIVWGFTGPWSARFSGFVPGPGALLAHLRGRDGRHLGHNPAGALMVLALLAAVLALGASGALILGGMFKIGPFAAESFALGRAAREVHEPLAFAIAGLVALHLAGVAFESLRHHENLARSMVIGLKPRRAGEASPPSVAVRPRVALLALLVLSGAGGAAWGFLSARPAAGLPAPIPRAVAGECAACHMAYHASLLPAASWQEVMATLSDHFGEDASLPPATAQEIEGWLVAHAAGAPGGADTLPAHLFARVDPAQPARITATPAWIRIHRHLPDALFQARDVGAKSNCAACHQDAASGRFSPFKIDIPEENEE